ncbi:MAG TPA: reverse transcriptase/maturase family protein [Myxococcota bacterium]|nr:reverse transcriptase/maturase family protein [Myxococcota bacterium]
MKRVGHLFPDVVSFLSLCDAAGRVLAGRRVKPAYAGLAFRLEPEVIELQRELMSRTYRPRPYVTFQITDPKARMISSAHVRDRIVQHSLCAVLEPIFERVSIFDSYACRNGKGTHKALARVRDFGRRYGYFLKFDVRHFFETVDHVVLKGLIRRVVKDPDILWLTDLIIDAGAPGSATGKGLPIGNLTSQHFANYYLTCLDHFIKDDLRMPAYVRYMDDGLMFGDDKAELQGAFSRVVEFLEDRLKLQIKDEVTLLAPVSEGISFVGFRVWKRVIRLNSRSRIRFIRGVRRLQSHFDDELIDLDDYCRSMASRIGHLAHCGSMGLRKSVFTPSQGFRDGRVQTG